MERSLGFEPTDREFEKLGYDIESRVARLGRLRFLEVKGRVAGADTVTVTKMLMAAITRNTVSPFTLDQYPATATDVQDEAACGGRSRFRPALWCLNRRLFVAVSPAAPPRQPDEDPTRCLKGRSRYAAEA